MSKGKYRKDWQSPYDPSAPSKSEWYFGFQEYTKSDYPEIFIDGQDKLDELLGYCKKNRIKVINWHRILSQLMSRMMLPGLPKAQKMWILVTPPMQYVVRLKKEKDMFAINLRFGEAK